MSYEQVSSINSVELGSPAGPPVQIQQTAQVKPIQPKVEVAPDEKKVAIESKTTMSSTSNVSLKFIVDKESNNITVLVLDKSNNKIIRAIPPEELNNFQEGDLLSLFA